MKAGGQRADMSSLFGNSADPEAQTDPSLAQSAASATSDATQGSIESSSAQGLDTVSESAFDASQSEASTSLTLFGHDGPTAIVPVRHLAFITFFLTLHLPITTARNPDN